MRKHGIEPGLMQVFRFYAWLRFSAFLFTIIPFFFIFGSINLLPFISWVPLFTGINIIILLGYLYLPQHEHFPGNWYVPFGIAYATICLLIEQNYLYIQRGIGQIQPFMYILLILVAWQYDFRAVIIYTISTILIEIALGISSSIDFIEFFGNSNTEVVVAYGTMFARAVTFIIIGFTVHHLVEAQRQQRQALSEANQKLVSHAATLEQLTISRERNRLSRELHDTLAHTLSAIAVQLDAVLTTWQDSIPEKGKTTLEQMLTTTRNGLNETRRVLRALRASPLEELGLANAIRTLAEDVAARGNLGLKLDVPENVDDLPPDIEQGFYRVAQESLENVIQHAQATQLSVHLESRDKQVTLSITDNGKGINPKKLPDERGLGIKGMKERAELMGASLQIQSPPQGGTTIKLTMEQKT
ncbi:MAG: sensor histidine kinase [Chloroflexi bacterium]|nr:sensor histidine kinase [Chloroflexota bacterium]